MNRKKVVVLAIVAGVILVGTLMMSFYKARSDISELRIILKNEEIIMDREWLINHPEAQDFSCVVRSSGKKPVEAEYRGVELSKLLKSLEIEIEKIESISFYASDHYKVILSGEELRQPFHAFLTFERDGQLLQSQKKGGNGPYQLITRNDPFSQRWLKHVIEIIIEEEDL